MTEHAHDLQPLPSKYATFLHILLLVALIPIGLGTKSYHGALQGWVHHYAGDLCYAMFLYLVLRLLRSRASKQRGALLVLLFCVAVEFAQLIRTPFLRALRSHVVGAIILGNGFDWLDLPHYAAGIAAAVVVERLINTHF